MLRLFRRGVESGMKATLTFVLAVIMAATAAAIELQPFGTDPQAKYDPKLSEFVLEWLRKH